MRPSTRRSIDFAHGRPTPKARRIRRCSSRISRCLTRTGPNGSPEASELGLDYWLDIHNLGFSSKSPASVPAPILAAVIAVVIEMALLNCTHIVSLQTKNARGSRWVPVQLRTPPKSVCRSRQTPFQLVPERHLARIPAATTWPSPSPQRDKDLYAWLGSVAGTTMPQHPNRIWRGAHSPPKHSLPN